MEVMQGDVEKIKYLQKIAGLSLTGNTAEETCFILYGSTTCNGKSTFCETIIHLRCAVENDVFASLPQDSLLDELAMGH